MMTTIEFISKNIARSIDQVVRAHGHEPSEFYKKHNLCRKIWRIKCGKSFSFQGVQKIVELAEKDL